MAYESDWETSSGLALDGATVIVTEMEFGYNNNIGAGVTCANFTFTDEDGEEIEQSFSVGKNFEASRDGSELIRKGNAKINNNTNFGLLMESIKALFPGTMEEKQAAAAEALGGSPLEASTWLGTSWTFGSITKTTRNPTTGAEKEAVKFIVTEFHGRPEAEAKPAAKKAAAKPATSAGAGSKVPAGIEDDLWESLVSLAGEHDEHEDFVNAALELDEVSANKAAQKAVMGTKAGSVWHAKGAA